MFEKTTESVDADSVNEVPRAWVDSRLGHRPLYWLVLCRLCVTLRKFLDNIVIGLGAFYFVASESVTRYNRDILSSVA
jgi:hypothetical protein